MMNSYKTDAGRRKFISKSASALAAFSIVPGHVVSATGKVPPSDTLYVGGIGVGGKGYSDLRSFSRHKNVKIVSLCDVDMNRASRSIKEFKKATFYKDHREMLDKEDKNLDAVSVSTPDHSHAVQSMNAIQRNKHVYVQKPLTHDIYEARMLTKAAKEKQVVTQMGNQGASGDGVRIMREWYENGLIGTAREVYVWTDRPVWPQGISWPKQTAAVPQHLDWDLWLGTAPYREYVEKLVPFNWRGWWDYGTGALGDMGCHLIEPAYQVLQLGYPDAVSASVGSVYIDEFKRGFFPDSCPPSSHVTFDFSLKSGGSKIKLHWMDGGIQPSRPDELAPNEVMGDGGNGVLITGDKGSMMCGTYGSNPQLLPTKRTSEISVKEKYPRVKEGHYHQWVNACMAGYGNYPCSSDFDIAGPLTECILMGNLAIRSHDIKTDGGNEFPGRNIKLVWDAENMSITNFEAANQFVKRDYREGWSL